jgi:hypothetical protein
VGSRFARIIFPACIACLAQGRKVPEGRQALAQPAVIAINIENNNGFAGCGRKQASRTCAVALPADIARIFRVGQDSARGRGSAISGDRMCRAASAGNRDERAGCGSPDLALWAPML